nr:Hsp20/alpha crystallin family protein [uncultured Anaeromusa sp.]
MFGLVPFRRAGGEVGKRLDSLDRMMDQFFDEPWGPLQGIRSGFRVDVKETDAAYLLEADLPGVKKEEISLTYDEHYLTISARRGEEKETKEENYVRRERHAGQVQRSFFIRDVDATKIEAAFDEGVLKVTLPKLSPTPTNKQIEIR